MRPKLIDLPEQRHTAFANHANILVIQPKLISNFARAAASCFTKANTVTGDLFKQHWDSAHNMSRGIALNNEDTGHCPDRRINPTARNSGWHNPLNEQQQLRETTRPQGYRDPLERFTPLPVGGANAANQLNNTRKHS